MFLWNYTKHLNLTTYMTFTVTQWKSKIVNFSWGENTKRIESTCFQSYTFSRPTKVICYILISCKTWTNYLWNCTFNLSPQFYIIAIFLEFWHEMSSSSVLLRKNVSEFLFKIKLLSIACHSRFQKLSLLILILDVLWYCRFAIASYEMMIYDWHSRILLIS